MSLIGTDYIIREKSTKMIKRTRTLWHILEEIVTSKVDIVNDLAKIFVEIRVGQVLEIVESVLRNVSLPLQLA